MLQGWHFLSVSSMLWSRMKYRNISWFDYHEILNIGGFHGSVWSIGWLVVQLFSKLVGWPVGLSVCRLVGWLVSQIVGCSVDGLTCQLVGWLLGWRVDWLVCRLVAWLVGRP